jgi:hypothetical protein
VAGQFAAAVPDTTIVLRQHAVAQPTPQQRDRPHLMLVARGQAQRVAAVVAQHMAAAVRRMAVAAVDIKAAAHTGRSGM